MGEQEICGGYDAEFHPPLDEDFTCCICYLAFREPMQLECGHQYCRSCLERYRETAGDQFSCPVDKEVVDMNKVFPDKAMHRKVLSLNVKCNNLKNCCDWSGELRSLEKHLESCPFVFVNCTNEGCSLLILKFYLDDHLSHECNFRCMICEYCRESYAFKDEQDHTANCECYPIECINLCGDLYIPRQQMHTHLKKCPLSILPCKYVTLGCTFMGTMNQRKKHEKADMQDFLMMAVENISVLEKEVAHVKEINISLEQRLELYEKTTSESNLMSITNTNDRLQELEKQTMDMMYSFDEQVKKLSTGFERRERTPIEKAYKEVEILKYGAFIWTIRHYQNNLEAEKISNDGLCSELFLSSQYGYVLRLVVYLNGWGSGKGTHLGICIQVARGPNDEILEWPFPYKMRLSILHPTDETKHISKVRNPTPKDGEEVNHSFFRPRSEYNSPTGLRHFISHESMISNGFLCDDTIHVMCKILE